MKVLPLIRKRKRPYANVTKIVGKNEFYIYETEKEEKEICAGFAVPPQTAKVKATVHKCHRLSLKSW